MKFLTIIQEDHPLLAEVTALLAQESIAVQDFTGTSVGDTAVLTLTVGPYRRAFRLLSKGKMAPALRPPRCASKAHREKAPGCG